MTGGILEFVAGADHGIGDAPRETLGNHGADPAGYAHVAHEPEAVRRVDDGNSDRPCNGSTGNFHLGGMKMSYIEVSASDQRDKLAKGTEAPPRPGTIR